jgi:hypothetical protein
LGCFLYERTGSTCPAARPPGYDPAAAERRIEKLSQAIKADSEHVVGLRELIALDAERQGVGSELAASQRLALQNPAAPFVPQDSRKEKVHVATSRTAQ